MSQRDLLMQWGEVEPERCLGNLSDGAGYMASRWMTVLRLGEELHPLFSRPDGELQVVDEGVVLAAVVEAIEAREGNWSLVGGRSLANSAIVTHVVRVGGTLRVGSVIGPDCRTPAEALLAAYLKAVTEEAA